MSDLRERLKKIAAQRQGAGERPSEETDCQVIETVFALKDFAPSHRALSLIAGADISFDPAQLLFLDTETTGLSGGAGTLAFLTGLGRVKGDTFVVTQYLMRDYGEENSQLMQVNAAIENAPGIVTFNGKSFDLPLLQSRALLQRMRFAMQPRIHIDLLHAARRLYKLRLGSCTLVALEKEILGIHRQDDIPSAEIPARWLKYVKIGDASLIKDVLYHNAQDVFSMAVLTMVMAAALDNPFAQPYMQDVLSLAATYERVKDIRLAERCYRLAADSPYKERALTSLSHIYRREGRLEEERAALYDLTHQRLSAVYAHIALAKLYEHRLRDLQSALAHTDSAIAICSDGQQLALLAHRRTRLSNKITRGKVNEH